MLPPALVRPSPARLRNLCSRICEERFKPKDLKTLQTFFGACSDKASGLEAIGRYETDRFKALGNFLKGKTTTPDDKIVELLAWLIDFMPRPYDYEGSYPIEEDETGQQIAQKPSNRTDISVPESPIKEPIEPKETAPSLPVGSPKKRLKRRTAPLVIAASILTLGAAGIYWFANRPDAGACMFWSGDHYQSIPCNQHVDNVVIIPIDSKKIAHFRKITRPDTISENALGSIWYAKYRNGYECYTAPGYHPIDTNQRLRLLNDYTLLKYIRPDLQPAELLPNQ